jgi:hypothetical protein
MRFINQSTANLSSMAKNNATHGSGSNNNTNNTNNNRDGITNCDNSSEISDSAESIVNNVDRNNNNTKSSALSDKFSNWSINSRHDIAVGLMKLNKKAFTVLCEPESENNENNSNNNNNDGNDNDGHTIFQQTPTARYVN